MKTPLRIIIVLAIIFLSISFIESDFNLMNWTKGWKATFLILSGLSLAIIFMMHGKPMQDVIDESKSE